MKKLISYFLLLIVLAVSMNVNILAAESTNLSGICGPNATYPFDPDTGTLTISGTGEMYNWNPYGSREYRSMPPWTSLKPDIRSVIIEDGVASIKPICI